MKDKTRFLYKQLVLDESVTIITDGVADRTIFCGTDVVSDNVVTITGADINITLQGTENSRLIFDGTGVTLEKSFISAASGTANNITMQYVTMQNIAGIANGAAVNCSVPLEVINCIFDHCKATSTEEDTYAGAIYSKNALMVEGCTFNECSATYQGGAIYSYTSEKLSIINSVFTNNSVENSNDSNRGGAIYAAYAPRNEEIDISGCTFDGNTAYNAGGAVYVGSKNIISISDSTFLNNEATDNYGGAVAVGTGTSTLNLSGNCVFRNNVAKGSLSSNKYLLGGAIFAPRNLTVRADAKVEICGNQCTDYDYGDAICINASSDAEIQSIQFVVQEGASLHVYDNPLEGDEHIDICDRLIGSVTPTVREGGHYYARKPVAKIGNIAYETLQDAVAASEAEDIIILLSDIVLDKQLVLEESVTITTDGEEDRTIFCGSDIVSDNVVTITGADINITLQGTENSRLIFDGTGVTLEKSFISATSGTAKNIIMQYVTMQNITGIENGAAVNCSVPLEVINCTFDNCHATTKSSRKNAGAIYSKNKLIVEGCSFVECSATYQGAAIWSSTSEKLSIINSAFTNNSVEDSNDNNRGGAIYVATIRAEAIDISGCTFDGNTAYNAGGAVYVANENTINISDSTFSNNKATDNFGGAVAVGTAASTLNLSGKCVFMNNKSGGNDSNKYSGAIFAPKNLYILEGAWVEMSGNECMEYASGDAIGMNATAEDANFVIRTGASLYVYDNPIADDGDTDICIKDGTAHTPTVEDGAIFSTLAPTKE